MFQSFQKIKDTEEKVEKSMKDIELLKTKDKERASKYDFELHNLKKVNSVQDQRLHELEANFFFVKSKLDVLSSPSAFLSKHPQFP